jgi:hypothetical protein
MKKLIVVTLFVLLIVAFSATVYAQKVEWKASGFLDTVTDWGKNVNCTLAKSGMYNTVEPVYQPGGDGYNHTMAFLQTRMRLKLDAVMDKNLSGTIFLEADSARWGETPGTGDQRNKMGFWSGDRGAMEFKNLYIDFGLPYIGVPVPISFRVGLQPLMIRPNMVVYTDGMGVTGTVKVDPATIQLLWFKALENKDYASDDVDVYGLHANAKIGPVTAGGYGLNYNMNTYPFADGAVSKQSNMWWLGAYMDGKLGPVDVNLDFVYDTGKVESKTAGVKDVDYRGWATRAKIDFPWEKFNVGVVGMYASGADTNKTSSSGLPDGTNRKVGAYVLPPGSEAFAIFTEGQVFYGSIFDRNTDMPGIGVAGNYTALSRGTIGGTWMAKLYASVKATPWYKLTLQALYIGDTTKHGNTVGTARKAPYGTTDLRDDKTIGWEFDLLQEFQIYKNLTYGIGAGFMARDKGLEYWDSATSSNDKPKTPWSVISVLMYTF